ncbi:MAG: putative sulfate/molybdate transporter, partial [Pseudomonadota bacterium]
MFDRLIKSRTVAGSGGEFRPWLGDLSGAFADLGTFLPLVIGVLVLGHFEPTGLLIGFGLFAIVAGFIYRRPVPVQPMKLVAALAIAGGLSAEAMMASGLLFGIALLILGGSGLIAKMHRLVPRTVLGGLQIALGAHLLMASAELANGDFSLGLMALASIALISMTPLRNMACIVLLLVGIAWVLFSGGASFPTVELGLHVPTFSLPTWPAFGEAAITVFWPQLSLTVTNAVLMTAVLAQDYFPRSKPRISANSLALSSGALNLVLAPLGAMPMCHGAGGLVAQYHQGARTGRAPILFGCVCLILGLMMGPLALDFLLLVPLPVVAAMLAFAGLHLIVPKPLIHANWTCRGIIAITALIAIVIDMVAGLA